MESYYVSKYPIKLCRDYMMHSNIYDSYMYIWEEKENYFLITFTGESYGMYWAGDRYSNGSPWAGRMMPRQSFKVEFVDLGEETGRKKNKNKIGIAEMFQFWKKKKDDWERGDGKVYCIVGLGNPEKKYENTRHNIGFDVIDALAEKYSIAVREKGFKALFGKGVIEGQRVLLVKPQTYMNLSGESVREVTDYYKIDAEEDLIVISDDVSLEVGGIRIRKKGSAGGHNGLKNIIKHFGTENFCRIRMGVGEKPKEWDLVDYVLGHFSKEEREKMDQGIKDAVAAVGIMVTEGPDKAMNVYNKKKAKKTVAGEPGERTTVSSGVNKESAGAGETAESDIRAAMDMNSESNKHIAGTDTCKAARE